MVVQRPQGRRVAAERADAKDPARLTSGSTARPTAATDGGPRAMIEQPATPIRTPMASGTSWKISSIRRAHKYSSRLGGRVGGDGLQSTLTQARKRADAERDQWRAARRGPAARVALHSNGAREFPLTRRAGRH
jgi:hypothetical protein